MLMALAPIGDGEEGEVGGRLDLLGAFGSSIKVGRANSALEESFQHRSRGLLPSAMLQEVQHRRIHGASCVVLLQLDGDNRTAGCFSFKILL